MTRNYKEKRIPFYEYMRLIAIALDIFSILRITISCIYLPCLKVDEKLIKKSSLIYRRFNLNQNMQNQYQAQKKKQNKIPARTY